MKNYNDQAMLFFVKYPTPGKVKTRLAKTIGDGPSANLYRRLAQKNFEILQNYQNAELIVFFDPPEDKLKIQLWLTGGYEYISQKGEGLGERLTHAFEWAFDHGYKRVIAYGSDTLDLTAGIVEQSFLAIQHAVIVLGPAKDGGYYSIGMSQNQPRLFDDIPWSTSAVLSTTHERIQDLKLTYRSLPVLEDLDEVRSC